MLITHKKSHEKSHFNPHRGFAHASRSLYQRLSGGDDYLYSSVFIDDAAKGCPDWVASGEDIDKTCLVELVVVRLPSGAQLDELENTA